MDFGALSSTTPSGTLISFAVTVIPGVRPGMTTQPFSSEVYSPLLFPTNAPEESVTRKVTPFKGSLPVSVSRYFSMVSVFAGIL